MSNEKQERYKFVHLQKLKETPGIFAVSQVPRNELSKESSSMLLQLQVATESGLYVGERTSAQICGELKLDRDQIQADGGENTASPEINHLVSLLHSTVKGARQIAFNACEENQIRISVKERTPQGFVLGKWSTTLPKMETGSLLEFTLRLMNRQEDLAQQLEMTKQQYKELESDRDAWKDTAQKLEGQWESEKTELFQNFCTLYTSKKENSKKKIEQLQAQVEDLQKELEKEKKHLESAPRYRLPEELLNQPDDHDHAVYPKDLVDQLAAGKRVVPPKKAKIEAPSRKRPAAKPAPKRRNEFTGVIEYYDADALVEELMEDAKKVAGVGSSDRKKVKKENTANDGDTASDDDIIDKNMEDDIMKQLESMQK